MSQTTPANFNMNTPQKMNLPDARSSEQFNGMFEEVVNLIDLKAMREAYPEGYSPFSNKITRFDFLVSDDVKSVPIESDIWKQNQRTILKIKLNKLINENVF